MRLTSVRMLAMFAAFVILAGVVVGRFFQLQVIKHKHYERIAQSQQYKPADTPAKRGTIYDRNLRPLAVTLPAMEVFVDPHVVSDPRSVAIELSARTGHSYGSILKRISNTDTYFVSISRALDILTALEIRALGLDGVYTIPSGKRVRPLMDVGVNVIGRYGDSGRCLTGIELSLDNELRSRPGRRIYFRDALGRSRPCVESVITTPVAGNSVVLTVDADFQVLAEHSLAGALRTNKAKRGCAMIVDPASGDILAMASSPENCNFPVRQTFEPGSAFKICVLSAALDMGMVDADAVFRTDNGKLRVKGGIITDLHPHAVMDLAEAVKYSSNVVAALISRTVGPEALHRYIRAFGFGAKTGIELEGESRGILSEPCDWSGRSLETISIGHEVSVTALQLAMAYAAIANGGELLRPRLVRAVIDERGNALKTFKPKVIRRVIKEQTAREMARLLRGVIEDGTGMLACVEGIPAAGKTGTAEKVVNGRYVRDKHTCVFVGFIPVENPKYVCVVVIDEPNGVFSYGGGVCGPAFSEIVSSLSRMEKACLPSSCLVLARSRPPADGSSHAVAARWGGRGAWGTRCPSVIGLTLSEAKRVFEGARVRWLHSGSGRVVKQDPAPGAPLGSNRLCRISLGGGDG
jgi:cell division protein FtsI (penicillin-binding protein 3)